jgi:Pyruvate/2-oxoacid:ferredoxin oxidoreductase gamma subunit
MTFSAKNAGLDSADGPGVHFRHGQTRGFSGWSGNSRRPRKSKCLSILRRDVKHFSIPATRIAEELGRKMVLNIVMMGFLAAVTGIIGCEAMRSAVKASAPKGTEHLNLNAFDKGYEYGLKIKGAGTA